MPRELTWTSDQLRIIDRGLDFEIRQQGATVWVALLGVLDRHRLAQLQIAVRPLLQRRTRRIVLDGSRLCHIDYRIVKPLVAWSKELLNYQHKLMLSHWSDYLLAILSMEDWDRELISESPGNRWWPTSGAVLSEQRS